MDEMYPAGTSFLVRPLMILSIYPAPQAPVYNELFDKVELDVGFGGDLTKTH